jgi:hypothetical protein
MVMEEEQESAEVHRFGRERHPAVIPCIPFCAALQSAERTQVPLKLETVVLQTFVHTR